MKSFYQIQNQTVFQGSFNKKNYFEGWYYKLVDPDENFKLAIIPGVALTEDHRYSHAFLQVLDGKTADYTYLEFPVDSFNSEIRPFSVSVDKNRFSAHNLKINVDRPELYMKASLSLFAPKPLPYNGISPGVMSWFSYFPFMECNHGIVSMNHSLQGACSYKSEKYQYDINFSEGKGYIEKDWGTSFPRNWIWMQTNNFRESDRSFMLSIANIPFLGSEFTGFLAVIYSKGKFHRFGTYNRSTFKILSIDSSRVKIAIKSPHHYVLIDAIKGDDRGKDTAIMRAPISGVMSGKCAESLSSTVQVKFYERKKTQQFGPKPGKLVFSDRGTSAGLEIMGNKEDF